jgi:hypothetical protein
MTQAVAVLAFLALAIGARADTLVDVTAAQCDACVSTPTNQVQLAPVSLDLELTVEQVTGSFFDPGYDMYFNQTVDEITSASGTLDGNTVSFTPDGYYLTTGNFQLGWLCFTADASNECVSNDFENNLLNGEQITWDAVDPVGTPEPATWLLLALGLALVGGAFARGNRAIRCP